MMITSLYRKNAFSDACEHLAENKKMRQNTNKKTAENMFQPNSFCKLKWINVRNKYYEIKFWIKSILHSF